MRLRSACAALVVTGLVGCGDSTLATPELRSQATKLCQTARKATDRIPTPRATNGAKAFLTRGIAVLGDEFQGLQSLHPSGDVAPVYATAVGALSHELNALSTAERQLVHGGDPIGTMKTLQAQLAPLESEQDGAWRALEIPACLSH